MGLSPNTIHAHVEAAKTKLGAISARNSFCAQ
jgi:DNA-binding CsgD family transcriptional regulator